MDRRSVEDGVSGAAVTRAPPAEERSNRAADVSSGAIAEGTTQGALVHRDLLAGVVHDLRSPLNAIALSLGSMHESSVMLTDPQLAARLDRCFGVIEHATRYMGRMLEELLEVTGLEGAAKFLQREPVNLAELVDQTLEMIGPVAENKGVALNKRIAFRAIVACDRARMLRVLTNLLSNAVKYTPPGGRVSIELERSVDGASVRVVDNGPGVTEEQRPHLFEPYWKGSRGESGIGLGLYIARSLVAAHGGTMWVETETGRGSAFCFTVPSARSSP